MALEHLTGMAIFARVVEFESFTRAARELGMTKSTVSKQIGRLEAHLGLRLLNRSTRQLSLTEAGAAFYQGCRRMVAEVEQAERAVSFLAEAPRGTRRPETGHAPGSPSVGRTFRRHAVGAAGP